MEVRITGADMNPYFALSSIFLLGLRGIEKKMKLPCPPISEFSTEDRDAGKVSAHSVVGSTSFFSLSFLCSSILCLLFMIMIIHLLT